MLPDLPPLSKCFGMTKGAWEERSNSDQKRVVNQKSLSILAVCAAPTTIKLYAFGVFLCGELTIAEPDQPSNALTVRGAILSEDFSRMVVLIEEPVASNEDEEDGFVSTCSLRVYDTSYLRQNEEEIAYVAKICAQVRAN